MRGKEGRRGTCLYEKDSTHPIEFKSTTIASFVEINTRRE